MMKKVFFNSMLFMLPVLAFTQRTQQKAQAQVWTEFNRYEEANEEAGQASLVVLIQDSITENRASKCMGR